MNLNTKVVGKAPVPEEMRRYAPENRALLAGLSDEQALILEAETREELRKMRKLVLMTAMRVMGSGKIETRTDGTRLMVWLRRAQ